MGSQSSELRQSAISLRRDGQSLKAISHHLGIPLSTLSGWLKHIVLTEDQQKSLKDGQRAALGLARRRAAEWHRAQKTLRRLEARKAAEVTLSKLSLDSATLDLALAMLYLGEGKKTDQSTTIANSSPEILLFVLAILERNYGLAREKIGCDLHLRADQEIKKEKLYWSKKLGIPLDRFKSVAVDRRSIGRATYTGYHGVCVLNCGHVAIQRKLVYLYKLFCNRVTGSTGD